MPQLQIEIERWDPVGKKMGMARVDVDPKTNRRIWKSFSWERVRTTMPAFAEAVCDMTHHDTQMVADIPDSLKKLIDNGQLTFMIDSKTGQPMAQLKGERGRIRHQIRLKEVTTEPQLLMNLQHLETQAALAMIEGQMEDIHEQIVQIRGEMQQDRLAKADAAWDRLNQALKIADGRRREQEIMLAIGAGIEAKHALMRHLHDRLRLIEDSADRSLWQVLVQDLKDGRIFRNRKWKEEQRITESLMAYDDLAGILNCVRVETAGHVALGDMDAARCALKECADFIETERLDDRDTILRIDSRLPRAQKRPDVVDEIDDAAQRILQFSALTAGEDIPRNLLEPYRPTRNDETSEEAKMTRQTVTIRRASM
ncbi:hypothetical protein [Bifidobacterium anseris]|uniref:hypothetical protein n=1 Tax=Bifidobacterium anseris TaxID=2020963 RepID=UPI001FAF0710|nr:hypothetical protein [Bifidobacterium anseris]